MSTINSLFLEKVLTIAFISFLIKSWTQPMLLIDHVQTVKKMQQSVTYKLELAEQLVVERHFTLTLEHFDLNLRLTIGCSWEHLDTNSIIIIIISSQQQQRLIYLDYLHLLHTWTQTASSSAHSSSSSSFTWITYTCSTVHHNASQWSSRNITICHDVTWQESCAKRVQSLLLCQPSAHMQWC